MASLNVQAGRSSDFVLPMCSGATAPAAYAYRSKASNRSCLSESQMPSEFGLPSSMSYAVPRRPSAKRPTSRGGQPMDPFGAVNLDLEPPMLATAVLELIRTDDDIALQHMLIEAVGRARGLIAVDEIEVGLGDVVDKLACLAVALLVYRQTRWFDAIITTLAQIFTLGFGDEADVGALISLPALIR